MVNNKLPIAISDGGIDTSDATATIADIALDKTAYVNGSKITGTANITTLNLFSQTTAPTTYDGFWVNTSNAVNKVAQVDDFLSEINTTYIPTSPFPTSKLVSCGFTFYDNKVYMIGGYDVVSSVAKSEVYIYDFATNKWSKGSNLPTAKYGFSCEAYQGKIYCIGGLISSAATSQNAVNIYDIATDTWSTGTSIPVVRSMIYGALYEDKIYIIGGWGTTASPSNTVYIYNITTNSWSTGASMPSSRAFGIVKSYNGYIYYFGGISSGTTSVYSSLYIYNIASNSWTTGATMPEGRCDARPVVYNNNIYIIGGVGNGGGDTSTIYSYSISGNTYSLIGNMISVGRYCSTLFDDLIYTFNITRDNYIYLPNGVQTQLYDNDTLIIQAMPVTTNQPFKTILLESNSFVGGYLQYFTDLLVNGINADIYYGDGTQWIKIRSAT